MQTIHDRITVDADLCNGKPTVRGYRITVATILDFLAAGDTVEDILEEFPLLEREDVLACIHFAAENLARQHFVSPQ